VILDVFSRYVPGWMVATRESTSLAERLIADTVAKQAIAPGRLTVHADRGSSMRSRPIALLLADLGISKSHSRPHVSDDSPYSEAQFKTLKYRPSLPDRFGSIEDARAFCADFFAWYNGEHRHRGIAMFTPAAVHHGRTDRLLADEGRAKSRAGRRSSTTTSSTGQFRRAAEEVRAVSIRLKRCRALLVDRQDVVVWADLERPNQLAVRVEEHDRPRLPIIRR
jgi:hypothetical protein